MMIITRKSGVLLSGQSGVHLVDNLQLKMLATMLSIAPSRVDASTARDAFYAARAAVFIK